MDIFKKCFDFKRADEVKEKGLYPYFHPIAESDGPEVNIYGKKIVMAGSNNYLGLSSHPRVIEAAVKATEKYGTSCSGSRYLTGTLDLHIELESRLANFFNTEACLLFSTGFQTALGIIPTLVQKDDYIISDKENHASIMSACIQAKGLFAEFKRYNHNSPESLEDVLQQIPENKEKLIVSDGIFSVTGNLVNLPEMNRLAKKYGARILIDDAHAVGVIGKGGRGTASHFGLEKETDLTMGTFSKTFASLGGFVAGSERVLNYLKHHSPALIFSASPTAAACASALEALNILEEKPELVEQLRKNVLYMQEGFRAMGFDIIENESAIISVIIGDVDKAFVMWRKLFDLGVFVNAFIPPGVPPNMSMMRTSYMAVHTKKHLDKILNAFEIVSKEMKII
jgi:8-amino-7-oxononanoate synthase